MRRLTVKCLAWCVPLLPRRWLPRNAATLRRRGDAQAARLSMQADLDTTADWSIERLSTQSSETAARLEPESAPSSHWGLMPATTDLFAARGNLSGMTSDTVAHETLRWTEAERAFSAHWRSERQLPAPTSVLVADDTMPANTAFRLASEGAALLWRGDFNNARHLLQALARRVDRPPRNPPRLAAKAFGLGTVTSTQTVARAAWRAHARPRP